MKIRVIIPTWANARSVTGVHEARLFENLKRQVISGLEFHDSAITWGEGPADGVTTLRIQLRETKKIQAWQSASFLFGDGTEDLRDFLAAYCNKINRGVSSWRDDSPFTPHAVAKELIWMPFTLTAPDAVICAARWESSGLNFGQELARFLGSRSRLF